MGLLAEEPLVLMPAYTFQNGQLLANGQSLQVNNAGFPLNPGDLTGLGLLGRLPGIPDLGSALQDAGSTITDTASAATSVGRTIAAGAAWFTDRNNWIRVAKVFIGALMILEGINLLVSRELMSSQVVAALAKVK